MLFISPDNEQKMMMIENLSNEFDRKYGKYMDSLRSAKIFSLGEGHRPFGSYDAYVVGTMFEQYRAFEAWMREQGSVSDLGALPNVAYDVIAASYGLGVAPLCSSGQPLEEQVGLVWFKNVKFSDTRKGVTAGDPWIRSDRSGTNLDKIAKYAGAKSSSEALANTADGTTTYNLTMDYPPVRPNMLEISVPALSLVGIDNGQGLILGNGIHGTVDYINGTIVLNFATNPGGVHPIVATYHQDFEKSADVPEIETSFDTRSVTATVHSLKQKNGRLQTFAYNKRFGGMLEDEMVNDLSQAMAAVASTAVIDTYADAFAQSGLSALTFDLSGAPANGITRREQERDLELVIDEADGAMNQNAGRGGINRLVCGTKAATVVMHQEGFLAIPLGNQFGPQVIGTMKGKTVIRAPQIADNEIRCGYVSPISPFEATAVRGIYMPLFITGFLPDGVNPMLQQRAVAEWAAYEALVPRFSHKILITF